jgi:hypothetical protein
MQTVKVSPKFQVVFGKLTTKDDRDLWQITLTVLSHEFLQRYDREAKKTRLEFSRWCLSPGVRPYQTRWTAAGGLAWPEGYKDFSPELDWSVILLFRNRCWMPIEKCSAKRRVVFRMHHMGIIFRWRK